MVAPTYADDVSATCVSSSTEELVRSVAKFDRVVRALEEVQFGEIATTKSFTFGHPCLKHKILQDFQHLQKFKIVGGFFVTETNKPMPRKLSKDDLRSGMPP